MNKWMVKCEMYTDCILHCIILVPHHYWLFLTFPEVGVYSCWISCRIVLLPFPLGPTSATVWFGSITRLRPPRIWDKKAVFFTNSPYNNTHYRWHHSLQNLVEMGMRSALLRTQFFLHMSWVYTWECLFEGPSQYSIVVPLILWMLII